MTRTKHHTPHYESNGTGNFNLSYHLEMVSDRERVTQFKNAIDATVNNNTIFCELGCGTGIFTIYAAKKAKNVYAVEYDETIFKVAQKNIQKSGYADKIVLIHGDASKIQLPEKVDVIFCEMLSIWMIEEPQIPVMNHAVSHLLKPGGITIPDRIINLAELCNIDYTFGDIEIKAPIAQFTGIRIPRIMTESKVFGTFSMKMQNPIHFLGERTFIALTSGEINSVRLSSIVAVREGINFFSTDTLMPLTIMPLKESVYVSSGCQVMLSVQFHHWDKLESTHLQLTII